MEKQHEDDGAPLAQKRKPEPMESPEHDHKKSKLESAPSEEEKKMPKDFAGKLEKFKRENVAFFESLKHENSVLLVKNSPQHAFGNYSNYYGLRYLKRWEDSRVHLIKSEWVKGKKCLDIGCNEGIFTILLAIKHEPAIVVGCDIDYTLVTKAIANLRSLEKNRNMLDDIRKQLRPEAMETIVAAKSRELLQRLEKLPKSFTMSLSLPKELAIKGAQPTGSTMEEGKGERTDQPLADRLIFRQENYIADMETAEKYDAIFCLSTAKWIHLNYGDVGIQTLFYKVYNSLSVGGVFVFEPQPWKSYKKKKHLSPQLKEGFKKIRIMPNQFEEFLTDTIGFKLVEKLFPSAPVRKGYNRPIFVLRKEKPSD